MNVQAEVSLYPLRTNELDEAIDSFLGDLENAGLTVHEGNMSTMLSGDIDQVFSAISEGFKSVTNGCQIVLVLKVSNACPAGGAVEGRNVESNA